MKGEEREAGVKGRRNNVENEERWDNGKREKGTREMEK